MSSRRENGEESRPTPPFTFEDVRERLESVLEADLGITGNYFSQAEYDFSRGRHNPELQVEGVGLVQLPLDADHARKIIEVASQAPYGHGEQTIVNTHVRDSWQIEPSKVQFEDAWQDQLDDYVEEICQQMGVSYEDDTEPTCEFHILLIYETGSHFLPHQDSEKAPGMFASMIIILPSAYTGGQVHLKHGPKPDVLDYAQNSKDKTVVFGWSTDVVHEVKPVTSGYRLALSYSLIHQFPQTPRPQVEIADSAVSKLRIILGAWKATGFKPSTHGNMLVYVFKHQYSQASLSRGACALKGRDGPLANCLRELANEIGFTVLMGQMSYEIQGLGRDEPGLSEGSSDDDKPNDFYSVWERKITISNLFGLDGGIASIPCSYTAKGNDTIIPRTYFKNQDPDGMDHEGYMGNDGNNLEFWYRRTALIILPEEDIKTLYTPGDIGIALFALTSSKGQPRKSIRRLALKALQNPYKWRLGSKSKAETLQEFSDQALRWVDVDIWAQAVACGEYGIKIFGQQKLVDAMTTFGFGSVRPIFDSVVATQQSLEDRLAFIQSLSNYATPSEHADVVLWCQEQPMRVVDNLPNLTIEDVTILINFAKERGPVVLAETILPQIRNKNPTYDFAVHLATSIWKNKDAVLEGSPTQGDVMDSVVSASVNLVINRFSAELYSEVAKNYSGRYSRGSEACYVPATVAETQLSRLVTVLDFCIYTGCAAQCPTLVEKFFNVEKGPGRFEAMILPLLEKVRDYSRSSFTPLDAPPLNHLVTAVINDYFQNLPPFPSDDQLVRIRRVGCGCLDCASLDEFIMDPKQDRKEFELTLLRRHHVEIQLSNAENLVAFATTQGWLENPRGLEVKKRRAAVLTQEWQVRLSEAKSFLQGVGTEEELRRIMGDNYQPIEQTISNITRATGSGALLELDRDETTISSVGQKRKREEEIVVDISEVE